MATVYLIFIWWHITSPAAFYLYLYLIASAGQGKCIPGSSFVPSSSNRRRPLLHLLSLHICIGEPLEIVERKNEMTMIEKNATPASPSSTYWGTLRIEKTEIVKRKIIMIQRRNDYWKEDKMVEKKAILASPLSPHIGDWGNLRIEKNR